MTSIIGRDCSWYMWLRSGPATRRVLSMLGRYSARTTAPRSSAIGPNRLSARRHDWTFTGAKGDCAAVAGAGMDARSAHNIPNARPRARTAQRTFESSVIGESTRAVSFKRWLGVTSQGLRHWGSGGVWGLLQKPFVQSTADSHPGPRFGTRSCRRK